MRHITSAETILLRSDMAFRHGSRERDMPCERALRVWKVPLFEFSTMSRVGHCVSKLTRQILTRALPTFECSRIMTLAQQPQVRDHLFRAVSNPILSDILRRVIARAARRSTMKHPTRRQWHPRYHLRGNSTRKHKPHGERRRGFERNLSSSFPSLHRTAL